MVKFVNDRMILCKKKNLWLRIEYNTIYSTPVTFLKFIDCEYDSTDNNYLVSYLVILVVKEIECGCRIYPYFRRKFK